MNTFGNLFWFLLGGFIIVLLYLIGSIILIITIIGIPFGLQTLKLAAFAMAPFGKEVVRTEKSAGCLPLLFNIIWILVAGIELAVVHLLLAIICGITIIGIPFAIQHIKMAQLSLIPFGMDIKEVNTN